MVTVGQVVAETLRELGVKYVFGVPSGNWADYMAAIEAVEGLEFVLVSNEASGGFMADVCWRLTGTIAACFGTFGPGACNLTTGVCGGYLDRSPMIALTDEMHDKMRSRISQMNIDHQALFQPITKWTTRLETDKVKETLYKAVQIAVSEVPGPVHLGLPAGIGSHKTTTEVVTVEFPPQISAATTNALEQMAEIFTGARKPIVALGITSVRAGVREIVLELLEKFKIPAVLTPMAKGLVPEDHLCYAGVLAHALSNQVGETHQQADLIVGIGYDPVELNYEDWMPKVPLLHIDTAPADLDEGITTLGGEVVGNLMASLERLLALSCGEKDWSLKELAERREKMFAQLTAPEGTFGPRQVLDDLRAILPRDGIMTCDVGAHLHLIGQHWKTPSPECQLMTNGGSAMGFGIPSAIAAKLSCPERLVCCVIGDGGFYMMAREMATAMRLNIRVVFVVIMDGSLSLIRMKQERKGNSQYGTRLQAASGGSYSDQALFGVPVFKARNAEAYHSALQAAFAADGPVIIEAFIDPAEYENLILK
jgi:acetolactate synthase-1/2/3 large subunit